MAIELVTTANSVSANEVRDLYLDYEWWEDRSVEEVARAIEETDVFLGLRDTEVERLVASARILTDYTYYASIYDVIVAEDRRDEGLGEQLINAVVEHSALQSVEGLRLDCESELISFYEKAGFEVRDLDTDFQTMIHQHREE